MPLAPCVELDDAQQSQPHRVEAHAPAPAPALRLQQGGLEHGLTFVVALCRPQAPQQTADVQLPLRGVSGRGDRQRVGVARFGSGGVTEEVGGESQPEQVFGDEAAVCPSARRRQRAPEDVLGDVQLAAAQGDEGADHVGAAVAGAVGQGLGGDAALDVIFGFVELVVVEVRERQTEVGVRLSTAILA